VNPIYPPQARESRVSGSVVLKATIDKEGTVKDVSVMSGPALLRDAAVDAVKQWRYKPVLIDDAPVDVMTVITLTFTLPPPRLE
jgi:protein TonB